jgi:hypothetical protein
MKHYFRKINLIACLLLVGISDKVKADFMTMPEPLMQDLPCIKRNLKEPLSVPHLDIVCELIAQKETVVPVTTMEFALQEAAECLIPEHTTLTKEEILALATRLEDYYKKLDPSTNASDSANATTDRQDAAPAIAAGDGWERVGTRAVQDRTSKTFRNIDVIRNTDTRYLSVARNAVIVGNLTVGGNQTIDGNLTVTGTINGSTGGGGGTPSNAVINGGQTGPVVVGTTNSTPLTFKTNSTNSLSINASGAVNIPAPSSGPGLSVAGGLTLTGLSGAAASDELLAINNVGTVAKGPILSDIIVNDGQAGPLLIGTTNVPCHRSKRRHNPFSSNDCWRYAHRKW